MAQQEERWLALRAELADAGIAILLPEHLRADERRWLDGYFIDRLFPVLTPLAIDPAHPFPFIPNLGFSLALELVEQSTRRQVTSLVRVPSQVERFIRLPEGERGEIRFIALEDVVELCLDRLFPGFSPRAVGRFRIVRDSDIELEEEAEDLVRSFESALKRRRRGSVIRLEVDAAMPASMLGFLADKLGVAPRDVVKVGGFWGSPTRRCSSSAAGPISSSRPTARAFPNGFATSAATVSPRSRPRTSSSITPMRASMSWSSSCTRRRGMRT